MEEKEVYKEVLNKVAKLIVESNVYISYSKDSGSFSVMLFTGEGDAKECVYNGYFTKSESEKSLMAKCEGFTAIVNYLNPQQ